MANIQSISKSIARLDADLMVHEENVAEAADLFAEGKVKQEDLDGAVRARDAALGRRAAMESALEGARRASTEAARAEAAAQRQAAADAARALLVERGECAADLDSAINALVSNLLRFDELSSRIRVACADAGVDDGPRHHLTNIQGVAGVLSDKLLASGMLDRLGIGMFAPRLQATVSAVAEGSASKLLGHLARVR